MHVLVVPFELAMKQDIGVESHTDFAINNTFSVPCALSYIVLCTLAGCWIFYVRGSFN